MSEEKEKGRKEVSVRELVRGGKIIVCEGMKNNIYVYMQIRNLGLLCI